MRTDRYFWLFCLFACIQDVCGIYVLWSLVPYTIHTGVGTIKGQLDQRYIINRLPRVIIQHERLSRHLVLDYIHPRLHQSIVEATTLITCMR